MNLFRLASILLFSMMGIVAQESEGTQAKSTSLRLARGGQEFKVFQFPRDQMPRIDGRVDDWAMVPASYRYGTQLLNDTEDGHGTTIDPQDLDLTVTVGWVKGLNRLYVLYEAFDDYWDFGRFSPKGYQNDIFEIAVDGDLSGGPFIFNPVFPAEEMKWASKSKSYLDNHFEFSGVHAQNYHFYTPPVNNAWVLVWGSQPWIGEFPQSNYAYHYDFKPGESGPLVLELWLTPYDYAPSSGPASARESELREDRLIGLSWSVLDFDGGRRDGHYNLAHNVEMVKNASYLCAFRLMPLEKALREAIRAEWTFEVVDMKRGLVAFHDQSVGEIERWHWDFGDGETSTEANPIHQFKEKGVHKVITLTVEGAAGISKRTRYWEVMIR